MFAAATPAGMTAAAAEMTAATAGPTGTTAGMTTANGASGVAAGARMTATSGRCVGMAAANDRCMSMTVTNDWRMDMAAVNDGCTAMTAVPTVPAIAAAPADARSEVLAAPVPAWSVPAIVIPAIIAAEPDKLHALDYIQAVGRTSNRRGRDDRSSIDRGLHDRPANNKYGCCENGNRNSVHNDLSRY